MPCRPLNDCVFVEPDPYEAYVSNPEVARIIREGVIALPELNTVEKVSNTGSLISWGDACKYKHYFKPGAKVMFKQFGGNYFYDADGKKLLTLLEEELLAIYD